MALRAEIDARLPRLALPELILEVNARTGFADHFTHASEGGARAADVAISVCAVLVAEATNTGFEPLVRRQHEFTQCLRRIYDQNRMMPIGSDLFGACADTAGDGTAETYWPLFKSEVIARLDFGQPFVLTAAEIHAFLKAKEGFPGGGEAA